MCVDKQQVLRLEIPNILNVPLKTKSNRNISISQLIVSLEKRLMDLSETLQMVRDGFVKKSAELEDLQRRSNDKVSSFEGRKWHFEVFIWSPTKTSHCFQIAGKDEEISCLKAELENLSQKAKPKRGLLANIKDAVTSPRKHGSDRILRKTIRTPHHWNGS